MAFHNNPRIVTDGLVLCLDANASSSYSGSGSAWNDLSGNGFNYTFGSNLSYSSSNKTFTLGNAGGGGGGALMTSTITTSTTCTMVFWIKTTDAQSLFWGATPPSYGGGYYLGAYSSGNKEYYGNCGSPDYYQDTVEKSNIYDNLRDGNWHMVEFKNVSFSSWTNQHNFNSYGSYTFGNGECAQILMYDRNLTSAESLQNFNAQRSRFGL
tara:strand:+ start:505 stop:1134 length:630 start_codon:yes stop_codon:yes gene_type:complete